MSIERVRAPIRSSMDVAPDGRISRNPSLSPSALVNNSTESTSGCRFTPRPPGTLPALQRSPDIVIPGSELN